MLAHAFTEATATPNGIPKSPSCFPANGGTYPAAGGIPALPIANGNTVKDARAPIGAAMPGEQKLLKLGMTRAPLSSAMQPYACVNADLLLIQSFGC